MSDSINIPNVRNGEKVGLNFTENLRFGLDIADIEDNTNSLLENDS